MLFASGRKVVERKPRGCPDALLDSLALDAAPSKSSQREPKSGASLDSIYQPSRQLNPMTRLQYRAKSGDAICADR